VFDMGSESCSACDLRAWKSILLIHIYNNKVC